MNFIFSKRIHSKKIISRLKKSRSISNGFINLPKVKSTTDFIQFAKHAIVQCDQIQDAVTKNGGKHNKSDTLLLLDSISNVLCTAIDAAEFSRNVHSNSDFRGASEEVFSTISQYIHTINTNRALYLKLCEVSSENNDLSTEEKIFAVDLKKEFESDGIHLETEIKKQSIELQGQIVKYEAEFMRQVTNDNSVCHLGPMESNENLIGLKSWLSQYSEQDDDPEDSNAITLNCPTNHRISLSLLRSLDDAVLREQIGEGSETNHMLTPCCLPSSSRLGANMPSSSATTHSPTNT